MEGMSTYYLSRYTLRKIPPGPLHFLLNQFQENINVNVMTMLPDLYRSFGFVSFHLYHALLKKGTQRDTRPGAQGGRGTESALDSRASERQSPV